MKMTYIIQRAYLASQLQLALPCALYWYLACLHHHHLGAVFGLL